jgi:hypothetical protein
MNEASQAQVAERFRAWEALPSAMRAMAVNRLDARARDWEGCNFGGDALDSMQLAEMARRVALDKPRDVEAAWVQTPLTGSDCLDASAPIPDFAASYRAMGAQYFKECRARAMAPDLDAANHAAACLLVQAHDNPEEFGGSREPDGPIWPGALVIDADGKEGGILPERWAAYGRLCESETGRIIGHKQAEKRKASRAMLSEQDETLAAFLEKTGLKMRYTADERAPTCILPLAEMDAPIVLSNLRRVNFFAEQASMRRAGLVRLLTYWLSLPENMFARMFTLTSGDKWRENSRLTRLKFEKKKFHKAVSDLSREEWFKKIGALVFAGFEFGSIDWNVETFDFHVHLHAHCVFLPHGFVDQKLVWFPFMDRVAEYIGKAMDNDGPAMVDDAGCVKNANEFAKYPVKPQELEKLVKLGGPIAVRRFFDATFGMRLLSVFGPLRALAQGLDDNGERLSWMTTPDGKVLARDLNVNAGRRPKDKERAALRAEARRTKKNAARLYDRGCRRNRAAMTKEMRSVTWRLVRLDAEFKRIDAASWKGNLEWRDARKAEIIAARKPLFSHLKEIACAAPSVATAFMEDRPEWLKERAEYWAVWTEAAEAVKRFAVWAEETALETAQQTALTGRNGAEAGAESKEVTGRNGAEAGAESPEVTGRNEAGSGRNGGGKKKPVSNRLLAFLPPAAYRDQVTQPALVVVGYTGQAETLTNRPEVAGLLANHADQLCLARDIAKVVANPLYAGGCAPGHTPGLDKLDNIHATRRPNFRASTPFLTVVDDAPVETLETANA